MLSSSDVSALFASQNAQFGQRNYFQVTTGAYDPTAMGVGAVGAGAGSGGFVRQPPMAQGVAPPPPVFSYAGGGYFGPGGGPGNAFAGRMMSGLGAGATLGGIGLGLASMTKMGAGLTPFVDPISMAVGGWRAGGLMGAAGAAALPLAIGAGASMAVGSLIHGGQQQQAMHQQIGQFSFVNPMARTGQGFTRDDASGIANSIRGLANVPEMLTSVEELTRLLPKMRSMGIMQGVKDAAEFQKRFKETVTTIRDMSRMLGSTMEEAAEFFQHSRLMGFTSRQSQLGNVLNAQFTSATTGMSMGSAMQMQAGGAAMARQFGGRGRYGAAGVSNIAQRLQSGLETGAIEEGILTDMTGLEGAEAISAGSQMMYGTMLGLSKTAPGRLIMAGAMKRGEGGRVELDRDIIAKLNRGEISADDLKARASRLSDREKMAFVRHAPTLGSEFAGQVDMGQFLQGLVGNKGPDAAALVLNNLTGGQLSEPQVTAMMQMAGQGPGSTDALNFATVRSREMKLRERTDPGMIWGRIKKKLHASTFGAIEESGGKIYDELGRAYDNFIDDLVGRHVISLSKEGADAIKSALSGGKKDEVRAMFEAASGLRAQGSKGGGGSRFANSEAFGWLSSIGKDDTTGLSAQGLRNRMESWSGYAGRASLVPGAASQLDIMLKAADEGRLKTGAGEKATEAIDRLFGKLHYENAAMREGRADSGKKAELGREAIYKAIASAMESTGDMEGISTITDSHEWLAKNQGKWTNAEWEARAAALEKGGKGDVASIIRAGISGKEQHGIADIATAAMMVSGQAQETFGIKLSEVTSGDLVAAYSDVTRLDKARKDAIDKLGQSGLSSESQAALKKSSSLRSAAAKYSDGKTDKYAVQKALKSQDSAALEKLLGVKLSKEDMASMGAMLSDLDKPGVAGAVKDYDMNRKAEDVGAIIMQAKQASSALKATAGTKQVDGKTVDTAGGAIAKGVAASMDAIASAKTGAEADKAFKGLEAQISAATKAYLGASKEGKEDIVASLGTYGEDLAKNANLLEGLAKKKDGGIEVNEEQLKAMGVTDADIARAGGGRVDKTTIRFDQKQWESVRDNLIGGKLAPKIFSSGQAQTGDPVDKQMLEALKGMGKNSDLQAALLATLVNKTVDGGGKIVRDLVHRSRTDGGTMAVDSVLQWEGVKP